MDNTVCTTVQPFAVVCGGAQTFSGLYNTGSTHVCIRNNGHEMSNEGQSEASKFDRCTKYRYIPGNTSSVGVPLGILVLARIKEKK